MTNYFWNGPQHAPARNGVSSNGNMHSFTRVVKATQNGNPPLFNNDHLGMLKPVYDGDVGYDLIAQHGLEIGPIQRSTLHRWRGKGRLLDRAISVLVGVEPPPSFGVIRTGVHVEMPEGYWGAILPRSSSNKLGMFIPFSVIDNGYRGELFPMVHNLSDRTIRIEKGRKFAQFIMFPMVVLPLVHVESLSESTRGVRGFGSSGG